MMKGIKFDDIHSYKDLNLILSKIEISPAAVKTNYVNIPGGDGDADLTEALGEAKFKSRDCKFTFTALPQDNFEEKKTQVSNLLNGKRCKIVLDKDPGYYWEGRCSIDEYASDKNLHKIVVGAKVAPYKLKTNKTTVTIPAGELLKTNLVNSRKTVVPTISNADDAIIVFEGNVYSLNAGTHTILNIELKYGANAVTVTSAKEVRFTYQEGDL